MTLDDIAQTHPPDSTLVICSHNFVILSILCEASGISLDSFRELKQNTAAYSVICRKEGQYSAEIVNEHAHLEPINAL